MVSQRKHKLDIFKVLGRISSKDREFYGKLSEEEQKAIAPLVVMRWLSGTRSAQQIYFLNELVNPFVFSMHSHKDLLIKLMTICGPGRTQKYFWNKAQTKRTTSTPHIVGVIRDYFGYSSIEAMESLSLLDDDTILWYADELGRQPDEIKLIKKELKSRGKAR